jgi:hypothetical protein
MTLSSNIRDCSVPQGLNILVIRLVRDIYFLFTTFCEFVSKMFWGQDEAICAL